LEVRAGSAADHAQPLSQEEKGARARHSHLVGGTCHFQLTHSAGAQDLSVLSIRCRNTLCHFEAMLLPEFQSLASLTS
jgi:hypothetical protein